MPIARRPTIAATMSASCHRGLTMNATLARAVQATIRPEAPIMPPLLNRSRPRPGLPALRTSAPRLLTLAALAMLAGAPTTADAAPKKYHFEFAAVTAKADVKADVAKAAAPRVEALVKKAIETHPQLVA